MKLILFELKKNWRRKKYILLCLLVLFCVLGMYFRNVAMQDEIKSNIAMVYSPHIQEIDSLLIDINDRLRDNPDNEVLQSEYENILHMNDILSDIQKAINNTDWKSIPILEKGFLDSVVIHQDLGGTFHSLPINELEKRVEKNFILLKHDLPYEDEQYSLAMANFMKISAASFMSIFGVIMLILLFGDQYIDEFENHTIRTLYTQPLKKWMIPTTKLISMILGLIVSILLFILFSAVVPIIMGHSVGSFMYPQLVIRSDGYTYISTIDYLIRLTTLFIVTNCFSFSLLILLSTVFKRRFSSLLFTILFLLAGILTTNHIDILKTSWNPFYYFQFIELFNRPGTDDIFIKSGLLVIYSIVMLFMCFALQIKGRNASKEATLLRPFGRGNTYHSNSKRWSTLHFEFRKIRRQEGPKQLLVILALLVVGGYILLIYQTNQKENDFYSSMESILAEKEQTIIPWHHKILNRSLKELEKETDEDRIEITKSKINLIEDTIDLEEALIENMNNMVAAYQNGDWATYYDYWINQNQTMRGDFNNESQITQGGKSLFTYKASIAEKQLLKERNLKPVLPIEYTYSINEPFTSKREQLDWKKETQKIDKTGLFYLYLFFELYLYFVPLAFLLFLFGAGFTSEKGKMQSIRFLETQPIARSNIYISKIATSLILTLGIVIGLIALMTLSGTIWYRFGDWEFPILHYGASNMVSAAPESGFHFITMGSYLVETVLLYLSVTLFLITLSIFISIFFNSTINLLFTTTAISGIGYFVSTFTKATEIAGYLPFTYMNIGKVANGELAMTLNNSTIQSWNGIWVLLISSVILFGVGLAIFKKK